MDFERKLRIQFGKALGKGFVTNASLDPPPNEYLAKSLEMGERPVVAVDSNSAFRYWFTDRRTLLQCGNNVAELFRYEAVLHIHWMFKDNTRKMLEWGDEPGSASRLKLEHYDRIVVEANSGESVLEGLDQSYHAIFHFLRWIIP
jgi:hypothetical protein